ncbi:MAG: hypothetical protein JNM67_13110 [Bacteroidetes bacterium]|nr:hypothetical protein [Bacteroidota bacterium]
MQLLISSPWWFILLCLLAGFAYAWLLYKPTFKDTPHKIMAVLRFLSITLLCFFLLGPILVRTISETEKPKILMVLDNSQSILASKQSNFIKSDFLKTWYNTKNVLGDAYKVEYLNIGGEVSLSDSADFSSKRSDLGKVFDYINNAYAKQNIGAVVLASDGIYNRGSSPLFKTLNEQALFYTIGLGDSSIKKDLILKSATSNSIAYLNNDFPVEINIVANECQNQTSTLSISTEGKIVFSQNIAIDKRDFFKSLLINLAADKPGSRHYTITLSQISGEHAIINNKKDIFIDIIDGREKILLAYNGPHPDIGALKESISSNKNYEVISLPYNSIDIKQISDYSVAILHQLPSRTQNAKPLINALRQAGVPVWSIVGSQSAIELLSLVSPQSRIDRNQGKSNEAQAVFNEQFNAFTLEDNTRTSIAEWPPLTTPYGQYAATNSTEILAYQKIGSVVTNYPIWAFSNQNGEKTAYVFGEGFWKWRLLDFVENESHLASNELVSKTIQYLTVKEDKRKFRVYPLKPIFEEDENVRFIAEVYNASYELINTSDVKLKLRSETGKVYDYNFSKNNKSYSLDLGLLNPGIYTFTANIQGTNENISGKVMVTALQTELVNTKADFGLLRELSKKYNGQFIPGEKINTLAEQIKNSEKVTELTYFEKRPDDLINLKWVFFVLAGLIAAEWFIRKYEGAY